jgi:NDP-sugar pyrophosphorylase family protein
LPKPLIPIGEIPIAELIMNEFHQYGAEHFYLIVNYKKNMIKAYFHETELPYTVEFIDEEKPLGTGGGLSLLKGKIQGTFLLSNCDILIKDDFSKALRVHREQKNLITMIASAKNFKLPYGVVELDDEGKICEMKEKPSLSFLTNTGCYFAESRIIEEMEEDKVIGFPDIIERYRAQQERTGIFPVSENAWYDMGQMEEMKRMEMELFSRSSEKRSNSLLN